MVHAVAALISPPNLTGQTDSWGGWWLKTTQPPRYERYPGEPRREDISVSTLRIRLSNLSRVDLIKSPSGVDDAATLSRSFFLINCHDHTEIGFAASC